MSDERQARARRVRVARARHDLGQEEVARLAGLDQTTVSKAEKGKASEATYDAIEAAFAELAAS